MVRAWLIMTIFIQKRQKLINMIMYYIKVIYLNSSFLMDFFFKFWLLFRSTIFIPLLPPQILRPGCTRKKNERTNPSSHFVHSQIAAFRHQRPRLYMLELSADKSPFYNSKKGKQKGRRSPWLLSLKKNTQNVKFNLNFILNYDIMMWSHGGGNDYLPHKWSRFSSF